MNDKKPITREWEGETWRGCRHGVVRTEWNGVIQNQRTDTQGERSRVDRVSKDTESGRGICIISLNIRSGRTGGMETVLRALRQGNIRIGFLQEMKITRGIHT